MISKIGLKFTKPNYTQKQKNNNNIQNLYAHNPNYKQIDSFNNEYCNFIKNISFTGDNNNLSKLDNIMYYSDQASKKMINALKKDATRTGYDEVTPLHLFRYGLAETSQYADDLLSGKKDYKTSSCPPLASIYISDVCKDMFADKKLLTKISPVLKEYISKFDKAIENEKPPKQEYKAASLSEYMVDYVFAQRKRDEQITPIDIYYAIVNREDNSSYKLQRDLWKDLCRALMENKLKTEERAPFSVYNQKAKGILKNISLGTDMFITYDATKETAYNFIDTIQKLQAESNNSKTKIIQLNKHTIPNYFSEVVNAAQKDKANKYIIIANPSAIMDNTICEDEFDDTFDNEKDDFKETVLDHPSNVNFIFYDTKDNYYAEGDLYNGFEEAAIPTLSSAQMIKSFKENPSLLKDIKIPFSKSALEKVISESTQLDGVFPEKTQKLMKKIVSNNIGKKEITEKDVTNYIKAANYLFKKNNEDMSVDIQFNTGKKLKDMVGKASTKQEAESIVKQIKKGKLGTKGMLIYSQDSMAGAGRRFTAKAIAGEAKIPYVEINSMDFGTRDVDLFGSNLTPEKSMKKLFSAVTTQAEANPNKAAVLFVENFEYFSVGELISTYHQKAMAQLLREMEKAEKAGLNILVIGSVSDPNLVGESAMKSFKFVDTIEVSSPAYNKQERAEIIKHSFKNMKIKLDGSPEEQEAIIKYASDITHGFPNIYIKNLAKKALSVMAEREHKHLTKGDLTEAYLQLTTGRPAVNKIEAHEKLLVASHECGHATNLEVMNHLAKTMQKPWHIPQKVNFVTLDPRGYFGGAVYHGYDSNSEKPFETAFSDIICSFGGNSAESRFFGFDGSWGITSDMENVRDIAEGMVKVMGMGAKTGKMTIFNNDDLSDNMKQLIEDDERVIINNAKITSELITEIYEDFNKEFTEKYAPLVGTGECIIDGDEFRKALNQWKAKQSPEKQKEIKECDEVILEIIEATKRGVAVQKTR